MKKTIKSILLFLAFISIYPRSFFAQKMHTDGTAWFSADNTPLPASAGSGVAVGYGSAGYIFSFDYSSFSPRNLLLQSPGGNVGIGTLSPTYRLDVKGYTRAFNDSAAGFVAETTGGTNTWARYYMRSSAQSWFIGTSQAFIGNQLYIGDETYNQTRFSIQPNGGPMMLGGPVGINTFNTTGYALAVNGNIRSKEVIVETNWADYVFEKEYSLMPLTEVEEFIRMHKHLPNIPSAGQVEEKGLPLGDMQRRMMEKIEELTLHIIQLNKEIENLKKGK